MNENKKTMLVIIDPQNDFMDSPNYMGSLAVNGAYNDMLRLSEKIKKFPPSDIVVTLDSHAKMHIAHPLWWVDSNGNNPDPFTLITVSDVENGTWKAFDNTQQEHSVNYVKKLETQGKYELRIWPFHCIVGTEGHKVEENLAQTLSDWEKEHGKLVTYVKKGTNPQTEHYSAFKAEVIVESDKNTKLNTELINKIKSYDVIEFAGEASSHCVAGSVIDYLENISSEDREKVQLIKNCMSPVGGYEKSAEKFIEKAQELGAKVTVVTEGKKYKM